VRELLLTGGTGTLGRRVVPLLGATGVRPRVLSRRDRTDSAEVTFVRGDTVGGEGLDEAVSGVDVVLHLAGGPRGDDVGTRNLVDACARAGVAHLVLVSVVGSDRLPIGFYRRKAIAETVLVEGPVPHTILRAAQFHDLVLRAVGAMARLPVVPVPRGLRLEPVATAEVAHRLVDLTLGAPAGRVEDLVGPEVLTLDDIIVRLLEARGARRPRVTVPLAGGVGRAYREGRNLAGPGARRGAVTWAEFLAGRPGLR
jgi:uncharacterized protein YbjT (DUF2867 family)